MNAQLLLLIMAFACFVIGVIDWPPVTTTRCISLGLALTTLAMIVH